MTLASPLGAAAQSNDPTRQPGIDGNSSEARAAERGAPRWSAAAWPRWEGRSRVHEPVDGVRRDDPPQPTRGLAAQAPPTRPATARDLLHAADDDLIAGREQAASEKLEQIIEQFQGSREAGIAKDRLITQLRTSRQKQAERSPTPAASPAQAPTAAPEATSAPDTSAAVFKPAGPAALRRGGDDFKKTIGDRIFFEATTARIEARQRSVLVAQAGWLKVRPETSIRLEAHADDPGSRELNIQLAQERAEAARAVLLKEGVAAERIEVVVLGNSKPVALCQGADGPARLACAGHNRRVITVVDWTDPVTRRRLGATSSSSRPAATLAAVATGEAPGTSIADTRRTPPTRSGAR